jgi:hypothetical protein
MLLLPACCQAVRNVQDRVRKWLSRRTLHDRKKRVIGSPRALIFDNLKAALLNGSDRAACLQPEFLALCGYYGLQPIACGCRDAESKGITEAGVRYVKHNAPAGCAVAPASAGFQAAFQMFLIGFERPRTSDEIQTTIAEIERAMGGAVRFLPF